MQKQITKLCLLISIFLNNQLSSFDREPSSYFERLEPLTHFHCDNDSEITDLSLSTFVNNINWALANPLISLEEWHEVLPYLLPFDHPAKSVLDKMFSKKRLTASVKALKEEGFVTKGPGKESQVVFAKHEKLAPYIIKIITDEYPINEVQRFIKRIKGAETARRIIKAYGFHHMMKVPKKWLYPLPTEPSAKPWSFAKRFILVSEDMDIYVREQNYELWKSELVDRELIKAVYTLIQAGGFYDSAHVFNIPFSKDGKIAIIDTECHHGWPVPFHWLKMNIKHDLRVYLQELIDQNAVEPFPD